MTSIHYARTPIQDEPRQSAGEDTVTEDAHGAAQAESTANTQLADRYRAVMANVAAAAARSGRRPQDIITVAVTKYAEQDDIRALIDLGHRDFGENKVQQLAQRHAMGEEYLARLGVLSETREQTPALFAGSPAQPIRWHMIGHMQRNKVKKAAPCVRLFHSVDSLRLAEELQTYAVKKDVVIDVLVQVNISEEEQKFGCPMPATRAVCEQIDTMVHVRVRGLMGMAPLVETPEEARPYFRRLRELFEDVRKTGVSDGAFNLLSMGMSGDYEIAIEEGANIVRVGSAIFGPRAHAEAETGEDE